MIKLPVMRKEDVFGKMVFLRLDLDVPLAQQTTNNKQQLIIEDDSRLNAGLPTIEYLLKNNAQVIIGGHLGRPKLNQELGIPSAKLRVGKNHGLSLRLVAEWFLKSQVSNLKSQNHNSKLKSLEIGGFASWEITPNLFLLENLRFYKGEVKNDPAFAKKLAGLADIYVNEAFANSHRNHASIVGVPKYLPGFAGFHLTREVEVLSGVLENPKRPLVVIIGGQKLETKLPLIETMHRVADYVLVGGKLAGETKEMLKMQHEKISPPAGRKKSALLVADLNTKGNDITLESIENFLQIISLAKTVVWNGPLGKISDDRSEMVESEEGSKKLAEGLVKSSAYTIVGGGDTVGFLEKACLLDQFACMPKTRCFLSTGGGAMLSFLSGGKLPGLEALLK